MIFMSHISAEKN